MELITPGLGLVFWMVLSFSMLLYILKKFAWKPIMKALHERETSIDEALNAANKAKKEMKELLFSNEQLLKEAKEERDAILRAGRKVRDSIIDESKTKANEEANRRVESAKERIEHEKMAATTNLKNQLAVLSIEIAEKILKKELSDDIKQKEFVNDLIKDINFN